MQSVDTQNVDLAIEVLDKRITILSEKVELINNPDEMPEAIDRLLQVLLIREYYSSL